MIEEESLKFKVSRLISTVWPIGMASLAQGTLSSVFAAFIGFLVNIYLGSDVTFILAIFSGIIGYYTSKTYISKTNNKDPSEVVIDEFSGQLIATSAAGISPFFNILAFILFRFFDILKPGIIRKSEKIDGALGIMMDDWLSGIFSAAILLLFYMFGNIDHNWVSI